MSRALVLAALLCLSCVTQDYVGRSYAPTEYVDVFFDLSEVIHPYEVMGHDRAEGPEALTSEQIVQQIVEEAKKRGAGAIIIDNLETVAVGSSTSTFGNQATKTRYYATVDGKLHTYHEPSGSYRETSYTRAQRDKVVTARFLKYRTDQ